MKSLTTGPSGQRLTLGVSRSLIPDMLDRYGPLMTLEQLAEFLGRSPAGIRVGLYSDCETSEVVGPAKLKIGRRLYFKTVLVGSAIDALDAS